MAAHHGQADIDEAESAGTSNARTAVDHGGAHVPAQHTTAANSIKKLKEDIWCLRHTKVWPA